MTDFKHKQFEQRKADHIQQSLDSANEALGLAGLDRVHLTHEALPELDFEEIDLRSPMKAQILKTPFFVSGMTAGMPEAARINQILAEACEARGWAMGIGSQRRDLERLTLHEEEDAFLDGWPEFRKKYPKLTLIGNLGISQIIRSTPQAVRSIVELLGADLLAIHLNAHQEVLQPEGTPQFKGGFQALRTLCETLDTPVLVKETGCGLSEATLRRLASLKLFAIDVSGLGGTHWGRIEGARAGFDSISSEAAKTFANWGESTVNSVIAGKKSLPAQIELWASGGVRSGLDAAKLIALGAHRVGYAKPALQAALEGEKALHRWMELQEFELKVALFCTGHSTPTSLRKFGSFHLA